ncbi:MAG: nucleotide exchange factor GrpE [Muribaculaceae bacterium]|jgi:molecular chaperone GrpE|nr:nucleotide exchange factor GrpE [Muribaculaceae bacterium]MBQ3961861.1 nucleotide exchange factor GrpE [Muribaculaceae bacterium]MBQ4007922.1 nucleotide exchange factor GrpE [Muribaculaceae bacterium]
MAKKEHKENEALDKEQQELQQDENLNQEAPATDAEEQEEHEETDEEKIARLEAELDKEKKEYVFLLAEFDNFRKRTMREKQDLIKNGAEKAMLELLPVIDDMERALQAIDEGGDIDSLKEGVTLIHNKFMKYLESQQVKPMNSTGEDFDSEVFEAVTMFPAPDESQRGKVIDTVLKGYMINDKVLRHAKVVVGQ